MEDNKLMETVAGAAENAVKEFVPEAKKKGNKIMEKVGYVLGGAALGVLGTKGVEKLTGDKAERELKKAEKMEQTAADIRAKYAPANDPIEEIPNEELPDGDEE